MFACLLRTRKGDLLWLEDNSRERKWISLSAQMKLLVHGLDMMVKAHYSMTCVVINILVAPKGVAAARSANACIRHCRKWQLIGMSRLAACSRLLARLLSVMSRYQNLLPSRWTLLAMRDLRSLNLTPGLAQSTISVTYSINKTGPSTLPCGTPLITGHVDEHESSILTYWIRPTSLCIRSLRAQTKRDVCGTVAGQWIRPIYIK